jgi:hypothetical protein
MIGQWLAIMYSHINTYNSLFDFYFFFLCYFSMALTKTKKNNDCGKISLSLWQKPYIVFNL